MTYHVDLVTDDMITYCEKTPKDLKQGYEKVETVQGEKSKKKIDENPLSSRFF